MSRARKASWRIVLLAVGIGAIARPALADEPAAQPPVAAASEDGEIIYARDVSHAIGAPYFPGASHATVTAPTAAITSTIALGLAPLTDSETARVTGSLPQTIMSEAMAVLVPLENGGNAAPTGGLLAADGAGLAGFSAGGTIGRAMETLSGALESLSVINGGRP